MSVSNIDGCVKAVSHVLSTTTRNFFIQLCRYGETVIVVGQEEQEYWQAVLRVNSTFLFSHLIQKNCCFKVTGVFQPLALYQLENSLHLSLIFMALHAKVPELQQRQEVAVLNGHLVEDCLFMCGRSSLTVRHNCDYVPPITTGNFPLVSLVAKLNFSVQDVFWLKKQHDLVNQKFSNQFLQEIGVLPKLCSGLREKILAVAVRLVSPPAVARSVMEEFLVHTQCNINRPAVFSKSFLTLEDIVGSCPAVASSEFWWHSCVEHTQYQPEMPLVAYFDTTDGQWTLKDSTLFLPCILTSLDHCSAMLPFIGNFVALTRFHLIQECFKTETDTVNFTYAVVSVKELQLVFNMQEKLAKHFSFCTHCKRAFNASHVCINNCVPSESDQNLAREKCLLSPLLQDELRKKELCSGALSRTCCPVDSGAKSVRVRILHKCAVRVLTEGMDPQCFVLALLLEENTKEEGLCSKLYYLELNGRLLMLLPLLDTDAVYKLWLPENSEMLPRQAPSFLERMIKTRGIIVLPLECSFYRVQFSQKCKDFYSVSESLQEGLPSDVMDLEGIITNRSHTDPKYTSEKQTVMTSGYGVPSLKIILLRLKDMNGGPETNAYLKNLGHHKYPLGLLPGSCVRLTMMEKRVTCKGVYFVSTALTAVDVLAVDQPWGVALNQDWGDRCLLLHTPLMKQLVWGTVVLSRLLKVSLKVLCSNCGCLLQGGSCRFVGCHKKANMEPSALLTAIVADAYEKAILIVKDKLVQQVLQLSEAQWQGLQELARQDGELLYLFKEKVQMRDSRTLGQDVFRLYCSVLAESTTFVLHARCRKYPPETNSEFNRALPILYCVDIRRYRQ